MIIYLSMCVFFLLLTYASSFENLFFFCMVFVSYTYNHHIMISSTQCMHAEYNSNALKPKLLFTISPNEGKQVRRPHWVFNLLVSPCQEKIRRFRGKFLPLLPSSIRLLCFKMHINNVNVWGWWLERFPFIQFNFH